MLLATLGASLLGNMFIKINEGKGIVRAGFGSKMNF